MAGAVLLGVIIKALDDANAAAGVNGLNVTLDAQLVADIKSIAAAVKGALPVAGTGKQAGETRINMKTLTVSETIAQGMAARKHLTTEDRKAEMLEAIKAVANEKRPETFIVDAVWDKPGGGGDEKRDNGSGISPVLKRAQQMGFIVSTGVAVRSQRGPLTAGT